MKSTYLKIFIMVFLCNYCFFVKAQYFIGKPKEEILNYMTINFSDFKLNTNVKNDVFKYLKFENSITQETVLFFLSDDDKCKSVRWISDYSNINDRLNQLNRNYKKINDTLWIYNVNKSKINVILKEDEWYFSINHVIAEK